MSTPATPPSARQTRPPLLRRAGLRAALLLAIVLTSGGTVIGRSHAAEPPPATCATLPATCAALQGPGPLTIVAFGSSSTTGVGASTPDNAYPALLERRLAARPGLAGRVRVLNRGVNGNDVDAMLGRMKADVIAHAPALVIWQVGSNAALRDRPVDAFERALRAGMERLRRAGIDVMLMDLQSAPRIDAKPNAPAFITAIAQVGAAFGAPVVPRHALMKAWAHDHPPLITEDGLHMTDTGYALLAKAIGDLVPDPR